MRRVVAGVLLAAALLLLGLAERSCGATIHDEVRTGNPNRVIRLLRANPAALNQRNQQGQTPLHVAAAEHKARVVQLLLSLKANPRVKDRSAQTPLHVVADGKGIDANRAAIVRLLVTAGADVNAGGMAAMTPLHVAAREGDIEVVRALVAGKADVNVKVPKTHHTALHFAAWCLDEKEGAEVGKILLAKGAEVDAKDSTGETPLLHAAERGRNQLVQMLLAKKPDVNARGLDGMTPLLKVVSSADRKSMSEHFLILRMLLAAKADFTISDGQKRTPLAIAQMKGLGTYVRVLQMAGAKE